MGLGSNRAAHVVGHLSFYLPRVDLRGLRPVLADQLAMLKQVFDFAVAQLVFVEVAHGGQLYLRAHWQGYVITMGGLRLNWERKGQMDRSDVDLNRGRGRSGGKTAHWPS